MCQCTGRGWKEGRLCYLEHKHGRRVHALAASFFFVRRLKTMAHSTFDLNTQVSHARALSTASGAGVTGSYVDDII